MFIYSVLLLAFLALVARPVRGLTASPDPQSATTDSRREPGLRLRLDTQLQRAPKPASQPGFHQALPVADPSPPDTHQADNDTPSVATRHPEKEPQAASPAQLLQQAEFHWQQGDLDAAGHSYKRFLALFPSYRHNHLIMVRLADILQQQQRHQEALGVYAKTITDYPASQGALISQMRMADLGLQSPALLPERNEPPYAFYQNPLEALQQLVNNYSSSPLADIARFKIAQIMIQQGDEQEALSRLRALLQKPLHPAFRKEVQRALGQSLRQLLDAQKPADAANALFAFYANQDLLAPEATRQPDFIIALADRYANLGLLSEAESLLQWFHEANPKPEHDLHADARYDSLLLRLGKLAMQKRQPVKAVRYLARVHDQHVPIAQQIERDALLSEAYFALGDLEQGLQKGQQCMATSKQLKPLPPASEVCLFRVASISFATQQYHASLATYQDLLRDFPDTRYRQQALFHTAEIYQELGEEDLAIHTLGVLRDSAKDGLWQRTAADALEHLAWHRQLRERLAVLQNASAK